MMLMIRKAVFRLSRYFSAFFLRPLWNCFSLVMEAAAG